MDESLTQDANASDVKADWGRQLPWDNHNVLNMIDKSGEELSINISKFQYDRKV